MDADLYVLWAGGNGLGTNLCENGYVAMGIPGLDYMIDDTQFAGKGGDLIS